MAGRTERVNAREIMDRADTIMFEGDAARGWLEQLAKRCRGTLDAAKTNKVVENEWRGECAELAKALAALDKAQEYLLIFEEAASRREKSEV